MDRPCGPAWIGLIEGLGPVAYWTGATAGEDAHGQGGAPGVDPAMRSFP